MEQVSEDQETLHLDKHCSRTNFCVGQTFVSDKHFSRTNFCVKQTIQSDKLKRWTNFTVGQTSVEKMYVGHTLYGQT